MFSPLGKLLSVAAFAGAALAQAAQNISIPIPASGTPFTAGQSFTVQVERTLLSSYDTVIEVGLVITACSSGGCPDFNQHLGSVLYSGPYTPQPSDAVSACQNFTLDVPNWFNGPAQINAALFSISGAYAAPALQFATTVIEIEGAQG